MHYLAIFLRNSIVTGMPYLPAKDKPVSLNRLSSRGLWKWYNSKVLDRRLYGVGQHFTFCGFSRKKKILWKLWLWFSKMFHQRAFSDWIWRISKFQFWRRLLDIYTATLNILKSRLEKRTSRQRPLAWPSGGSVATAQFTGRRVWGAVCKKNDIA